jgi:hypothetical protein
VATHIYRKYLVAMPIRRGVIILICVMLFPAMVPQFGLIISAYRKPLPHVDLAYKWINYMLEPAVAAACANFTNYAIANETAWKLVDSHLRQDPNLYPPPMSWNVVKSWVRLAQPSSFSTACGPSLSVLEYWV